MNSNAFEAILDVAIGMIFMWLVLSLATMSVQEWIASYLRWRSKDLETAIQRLLSDPVWAEQLYAHPLIQGLSKKVGKKPSYIPANKFALALFDLVTKAGTPESYLQQQLLTAKHELYKAPTQLGPFLLYLFKRLGKNLGDWLIRMLCFLGLDRGTNGQKFTELLQMVETVFHTGSQKGPKGLQVALKEFLIVLTNDKTTLKDGKTVSISSASFLDAYPFLREFFVNLLKEALRTTPLLKQRWVEILVHHNRAQIKETINELETGKTLREELSKLVEEQAKTFDLNEQSTEMLVLFVRQSIDEIDFVSLVNYILALVGEVRGLDALVTTNPDLHKSLAQLEGDIIGIANDSKMMETVRTRFAIAAVNLEKVEHRVYALRLNMETWFNESMDRLSGWYKRKATLLAFLIGLILASILNVDSVDLAKHLWKEPSLRQALASYSAEFAQQNPELPNMSIENPQGMVDYFDKQLSGLSIPIGWQYEPAGMLSIGQKCTLIPLSKNMIWGIGNKATGTCQRIKAPGDTVSWMLKILGLLLSGLAAAQGAPFWFDVLKKLVNVRGSGANPAEAKNK